MYGLLEVMFYYLCILKALISEFKVVIHLSPSYQFSVETTQMVEFRRIYFTLGKLKKGLIPSVIILKSFGRKQ